MTDFLDEFLDDYFAECDEHLTIVRRGLLALESSVGVRRPNPAVTEELFRSFHSVKGIAGMVEHRETELLAHEMESYLRAVREGDVLLTTRGIEVLIEGARALEHSIAARRDKKQPPATDSVLGSLRALVGQADQEDAGAPPGAGGADGGAASAVWECLFTPSAALVARGITVDVVRARLRGVGDIVSATPLVAGAGVAFRFLFTGRPTAEQLSEWAADGMVCTPSGQGLGGRPPADESAADAGGDRPAAILSSGHYVRVDLSRLDDLMRMIGDLVILRARLADTLAGVEAYVPSNTWRAVQEHTSGIERHLRELREGVMRVRLVPVGEIFRRMPFVVRDLARETGRRAAVAISGQDTEIDKFLVERMMDPVLHLVRNAVSHGLEPVEERVAAGKPPEGTISLSASAAGELVRLVIADDGRGVDAPKVIERARRAGLPVPAGEVDDSVLLELISSPGFSTRDESDRVSGRGFGMAVVRDTIRELGGAIHMRSEAGRGTRFVIDLPLTLAITDALIASVGGQTFAVPQASVREVVEIASASIRALQGGFVTPYRGAALTVMRLGALLGKAAPDPERFHAFVVGEGDAAVGLLVDRIIGQREIVVRSTTDPLIRVDGVSGATDLGDGRAVLILDAAAVARLARGRSGGAPALKETA